MTIIFKKNFSGIHGSFHEGQEVELNEKVAESYIKDGLTEHAKKHKKPKEGGAE